jgi:hypothetical protein
MSKIQEQGTSATTAVSRNASASEMTVYIGGPAIVREQRQVEVAEGKVSVTLEGLPEQYVPGSLTISKATGPGGLKLSAFSYRPANLSLEALLQKAVGKSISFSIGESTVKGTLCHVIGHQLVVKTDQGVQVVAYDSSLVLDSACLAELTALPAVHLEARAAKAGAFDLGIMYATSGLEWKPRFEAFYDAAAEKLTRLACWVDITNESGAPVRDTRFQLIHGYNNGYNSQPQYGVRPRGARMALAAAAPMGGALESASFGADSAEVESVGEQKLYTLPVELSIEPGETKTTALMLAENVPVTAEYLLSPGYFPSKAQLRDRQDKLPVHVRLLVKNDAASSLGVALPPGAVNVFEPDSKGSLQRTDQTNVSTHVAVGESFQLTLQTPSRDVKAKRCLVSVKDDPEAVEPPANPPTVRPLGGPDVGQRPQVAVIADNADKPVEKPAKKPRYRTETREVVVFNYKDKDVDVLVQDTVPGEVEFTKPIGGNGVKNVNTAGGAASYLVTVPAGGETKVKYTIKYRIA